MCAEKKYFNFMTLQHTRLLILYLISSCLLVSWCCKPLLSITVTKLRLQLSVAVFWFRDYYTQN